VSPARENGMQHGIGWSGTSRGLHPAMWLVAGKPPKRSPKMICGGGEGCPTRHIFIVRGSNETGEIDQLEDETLGQNRLSNNPD